MASTNTDVIAVTAGLESTVNPMVINVILILVLMKQLAWMASCLIPANVYLDLQVCISPQISFIKQKEIDPCVIYVAAFHIVKVTV